MGEAAANSVKDAASTGGFLTAGFARSMVSPL